MYFYENNMKKGGKNIIAIDLYFDQRSQYKVPNDTGKGTILMLGASSIHNKPCLLRRFL